MADSWQSIKIGDLKEYQGIFDTLNNLSKLNVTNAEALKNLFEIGKVASFASIDPLFLALDAIADEILDILNDLKEIGFYEIDVTPFSGISSNKGQPATLGSLFAGGKLNAPGYIDPNTNEIYPVGKGPSPTAPQGRDADGNSIFVEVPYFVPNTDAGSVANVSTGLLELTPSQVLGIMAEAFNDQNDPNRPQFSDNAQVSGIVLLAGAPDFEAFASSIASISNFLELATLSDLALNLEKMLLKNPKQTVLAKEVGTLQLNGEQPPPVSSGSFEPGQTLIGLTSGFVAVVDKVIDSEVKPIKRKQTYNILTATLTNPESLSTENGVQTVDVNTAGLKEQTISVEPISKIGSFIPGELISLAEATTVRVVDASGAPITDPTGLEAAGKTSYAQIKSGPVITGKVKDAYDELEQSVKPDFTAIRLKELIPVYGDVLTIAEDYIKGVKGTIRKPSAGLQVIIDYLEKKVDQATAISKQIQEVIDLFTVGIPAAGVYVLYLPPQAGGTSNYISRFTSAANAPPDDLKFCAGIMILNGGADITAIKTLGSLLGL